MANQLHLFVMLLKLLTHLARLLEKPHIVRATIEKILHHRGEWKIDNAFEKII